MNIIETNLNFIGSMATRTKTNQIILHHAEASSCTAQQIHQWHLNNGWSGAGYHFLVRKDGSVYRLRPENKVGAHASGSNSDSIGICFEGKYMTETMPESQIKAGRELLSYIKGKYGNLTVKRHKDVCATDCPGNNFPFDAIVNGESATTPAPSKPATTPTTPKPSTPANTGNDWVRRLQTECNKQGFSKQVVDGIPGTNTLNGCPTLSKGSQGAITKLLQERLKALGYNVGAIDGINGSQTQTAIKAFQRAKGLTVDGIVGKNTWRKLLGL